jgi:hypothetical protein
MPEIDPRLPQPEAPDATQFFGAYHVYSKAAKYAESQGDMEAAAQLRAQARQKLTTAYSYMGQASGERDPTAEMSGPTRMAAGLAGETGLDIAKLRNLVGNVPDSDIAERERLNAPLMNTPGGMGGAMLGQAMTMAPIGGGATGILSKLGPIGRYLTASPIARQMIESGVQGAALSEPGNRGVGAGLGAVSGAILPGAAAVGRRIATGAARTPEAQALMDLMQPGTLTPGLMNPQGAAGHLEQIPGLPRWAFEKPRAEALAEYNRVAAQRAAFPGTPIQPGPKADLVTQAYRSFEEPYNKAKGFPMLPAVVNTQGPDVPIQAALAKAAAAPGAGRVQQSNAGRWLQDRLQATLDGAKAAGRPLQSDDILELRSQVRQRRANYASMDTPEAQDLRDIYGRADERLTQVLHSQLPPDALAALHAADAKYGSYKVFENAAARSKDATSITPAKISEAVASETPAGPYARGQDITQVRNPVTGQPTPGTGLRDLAQQGSAVFTQDPFMRTGASASPAAALVYAGHKAPWITYPAATAALLMGKTQLGRRIAQGATPLQTSLRHGIYRMDQPMIGNVGAFRHDFQPDVSALRSDLARLMNRYATGQVLQGQNLLGANTLNPDESQ